MFFCALEDISLNFVFYRCIAVIEALQYCCEKCAYKSTHCASLSGLLGPKKDTAK
jgi:hypothetical protein